MLKATSSASATWPPRPVRCSPISAAPLAAAGGRLGQVAKITICVLCHRPEYLPGDRAGPGDPHPIQEAAAARWSSSEH